MQRHRSGLVVIATASLGLAFALVLPAKAQLTPLNPGGGSAEGSEEEQYDRSDLKNNGEPFWKETGQTCMREAPSGREVQDNVWVKRDYDLADSGTTVTSREVARMCGNPHSGGSGL